MRLIDAAALMKYCLNQKSKTISCNDIARFPTVTKWIPVSERLPDNEDDVFVLWKSEAVLVLSVAFYELSTWYEIMTMEILNVVAWMPIPEYRGNDNED